MKEVHRSYEAERDRLTLKITVLESKTEEVEMYLSEKEKLLNDLEELTTSKEAERAAANKRIG